MALVRAEARAGKGHMPRDRQANPWGPGRLGLRLRLLGAPGRRGSPRRRPAGRAVSETTAQPVGKKEGRGERKSDARASAGLMAGRGEEKTRGRNRNTDRPAVVGDEHDVNLPRPSEPTGRARFRFCEEGLREEIDVLFAVARCVDAVRWQLKGRRENVPARARVCGRHASGRRVSGRRHDV